MNKFATQHIGKLKKSIFARCKVVLGDAEIVPATSTWSSGQVGQKALLHTTNPAVPVPKSAKYKIATNLIDFHGKWPEAEKLSFMTDMRIIPNFITEEEESKLFEEIEPYMKRLRYEYDHWDDAIHGFRETERKQWYPDNRVILERIRHLAFDGAIMPYVHILDLAELGVIKPHVDSTRYCGNTIAGISLLSDSVMRLVRTDELKFKQCPQQSALDTAASTTTADHSDSSYRTQPKTTLENNFYADLLLQRRSLYIMSKTARYAFTHEILANEFSKFNGQAVKKVRRISIICRNEPQHEQLGEDATLL